MSLTANPDSAQEGCRILQRELDGCSQVKISRVALLFGIARLLAELQALRLPAQLGGDEQIDVERLVAVMEVDAVAVLRVVLDARAGAAPEGVVEAVVDLARPGAQRHVVAHHAALGILRREDVVVEGPLVVVGVLGARVPAEEVPRQLEHVVGVAGLGRVRAERLGELLLGREHLAVAVAADDVGPLLDHGVPEEPRGRLEPSPRPSARTAAPCR